MKLNDGSEATLLRTGDFIAFYKDGIAVWRGTGFRDLRQLMFRSHNGSASPHLAHVTVDATEQIRVFLASTLGIVIESVPRNTFQYDSRFRGVRSLYCVTDSPRS